MGAGASIKGVPLSHCASKNTLDVAEGAVDVGEITVAAVEGIGADTAAAVGDTVEDAVGQAAVEAGSEVAALLDQMPAAASTHVAAMVQSFKPLLSDAQLAHAITMTLAGVDSVAGSVGSMSGAACGAGEVVADAVPVLLASMAGATLLCPVL